MATPPAPQSEPARDAKHHPLKDNWHALTEWLRYHFDKFMAIGFWPMLGSLAIIALTLILVSAAFLMQEHLWDSTRGVYSRPEAIWQTLMHAIDTGTFTSEQSSGFRTVMLLVTLAGIFIMASLISIFNSTLDRNITRMRKGRTPVVERDYTLILGWSPAVLNVVSELVEANKKEGTWHKWKRLIKKNATHEGKRRIVILADKDKVEMEDEIRARLGKADRKGWRFFRDIICRTGNPLDVRDLEIVRPHLAHSIVVLLPLSSKDDASSDDPDSLALKTILAIRHTPQNGKSKRANEKAPYIVHELRDSDNRETAKLVGNAKKEGEGVGVAHFIDSSDVIARIIAQTCRQAGMSEIYIDLLNHNDNQIYFVPVKDVPLLDGKTFEDALYMLPHAVLIGLKPASGDSRWMLNPKMDTKIKAMDDIIVIAQSRDAVRAKEHGKVDRPKVSGQSETDPENTLILGWSTRGQRILTELNKYVCSKSIVRIVANTDKAESQSKPHCDDTSSKQTVDFQRDDPTSPAVLNDVLKNADYDHIIVLGDHDLAPQRADMNTLVTLLNLRNIIRDRANSGHTACSSVSIVSEMLVDSNRKLAEATRADNFGGHDFIVSDSLISSYMTQVSRNEDLKVVFDELLDEREMEIYLKPAANYIKLGQPVNFYAVIAAAAQYNECAIGYRRDKDCHDSEKNYGVVINPTKTEPVTFEKEDRIIVIAEKECSEPRPHNDSPEVSS